MSFIFFVLILHVLLLFSISDAGSDDGNIHLLKEEILSALENCESDLGNRDEAKEKFEKKIRSYIHSKRNTEYVKKYKIVYNRGFKKFFEPEHTDFGNNGGSNESNMGKPWTDHKDDSYIIDNIYDHELRDNPYSSSNTHNKTKNNARTNSTYSDYKNKKMDKEGQSVKDLNYTTNLYDPYMTRGIRSTELSRMKRSGKLLKETVDNECLSQCVFSYLQIIDEKGIPKEYLFMRLIQNSITSQQTKLIFESLIQDCFKEIISESEENTCSYSNALDRCMDLQIRKRKLLKDSDKADKIFS